MKLIVRILLRPLSLIYGAVILIWDWYWRNAPKVKLPGKIISIGNITAGGAGKTPLAVLIAGLAVESGRKVAVVARGYRRKSSGLVEVSDKSTWREVGDEPMEIYSLVQGVRVYVDRSKTEAARRACEDGAELIIVDDGFQHRRLHRDIDIVCLDSHQPLGPGGLLPSGLLREPVGNLGRADILIITSYDPNRAFKAKIGTSRDTFYARFEIGGFMNLRSKTIQPAGFLRNHRLIAFCGLAGSEKFIDSLMKLGLNPSKVIAFPDHFNYRRKDIDKLLETAKASKVDCLVTTGKDAVKIGGFDFGGFDVYSAMLDVAIIDESGEDRMAEFKSRLGL